MKSYVTKSEGVELLKIYEKHKCTVQNNSKWRNSNVHRNP